MKLRLVAAIAIAVAAAALAPSRARAQSPEEKLKQAQDHYDKGAGLYEDKKYLEAAAEFKAAYEARPDISPFLYNIGASYKEANDCQQAIDYFERYLKSNPDDAGEIKKTVETMKGEVTAGRCKGSGTQTSVAVESISTGIRGLVIIESDPPGAFIYLDSKQKDPMAKTPWNGTLTGDHTLILEARGFQTYEKKISPSPDKLLGLFFAMSKEEYLGWVDITSNVPGANIYIDDKTRGVYRQTPFAGNLPPGKHTFWINKEGYNEVTQELEVLPGKTHEIRVVLEGAEVGYLNIRGREIEKTEIFLDGKQLCEHGPCRKGVPQGEHTLTIKRAGYKPMVKTIEVQSLTEISLRVNMVKRPGHGDAIFAYVFSGIFLGGGIYLGLHAGSIKDDIESDIAAGMPPPDTEDPRFRKGKIYAIAADGAYALGAVSLLTAVYYTFREKGPKSSAISEVRTLAVQPSVGPDFAGLDLEVRW